MISLCTPCQGIADSCRTKNHELEFLELNQLDGFTAKQVFWFKKLT